EEWQREEMSDRRLLAAQAHLAAVGADVIKSHQGPACERQPEHSNRARQPLREERTRGIEVEPNRLEASVVVRPDERQSCEIGCQQLLRQVGERLADEVQVRFPNE